MSKHHSVKRMPVFHRVKWYMSVWLFFMLMFHITRVETSLSENNVSFTQRKQYTSFELIFMLMLFTKQVYITKFLRHSKTISDVRNSTQLLTEKACQKMAELTHTTNWQMTHFDFRSSASLYAPISIPQRANVVFPSPPCKKHTVSQVLRVSSWV